MDYIVTFYKNDILLKQLNFKQDLKKAKQFITDNRKTELEKGISICIYKGEINENYKNEVYNSQ